MVQTFEPRLLDLLESLEQPDWRGTVWREVLGHTDPLKPNLRGARWNPPGVEALYCSFEAETAQAEIDHLISVQPVVPTARRRRVRIRVSLSRVVDLRKSTVLDDIGLRDLDVSASNNDASRIVGHAVSWLGYGGLLVTSARHQGHNLVIYTNQMGASDLVELLPGD